MVQRIYPDKAKQDVLEATPNASQNPKSEKKTKASQKTNAKTQDSAPKNTPTNTKETIATQEGKAPQKSQQVQHSKAPNTQSQVIQEPLSTQESLQNLEIPNTNDTSHNATTNTQKNQKKSKTPKEAQTKTTQNSQNTQNKTSDTKLDSKQSPKENTESIQKSSPIDAPMLAQGMQITQDMLEDSLHMPENINLQETKDIITTTEHQTNHAPKAKNQETSQKSSTQPHAKTTQANTESTQNGDSKQQSQHSHTPQDSQKSSTNQNAQIANEEFLQDLEQSAQHIHTQTSKEPPTSKETTQSQTTNITPTMQTIKPDIFYKSVLARQSVYNFASQLTQEVLNYKPPITKLSLELNPQNLGTLELTISKNGKDLQVQVISNPTAINLFINNQVELRNNLAQMGFNNVDLSFSQNNANSGQKRQQGHRNQAQTYNAHQGNENSLETHTMFMTIPQYA